MECLAHSCSIQTRYTGHSDFPIWITQHMQLASELALLDCAPPDVVLGAHIHDLGEGFFGEMNFHIKKLPQLEAYKTREHYIEYEIFKLHGLNLNEQFLEDVKYYDSVALSTEAYWAKQVHANVWKPHTSKYLPRYSVLVQEISWREAKEEWLKRYYELTNA